MFRTVCGLRVILILGFLVQLIIWPSFLMAELDISGEKSFSFRDYGVRGDFSQFLHDNPLFINDRGFDQSLRIEVTGTINDNVYVDVSLDDSIDDKSDEKLLEGERDLCLRGHLSHRGIL